MKTKHDPTRCRMAFGRPTAEREQCPRCDELKDGAAPRKGWGHVKRLQEEQTLRAIRAHDFAACAHKNGACTHFEW